MPFYQAHEQAQALPEQGQLVKVSVTAKIRDDVMTMAAIGDVIEIEDFHLL